MMTLYMFPKIEVSFKWQCIAIEIVSQSIYEIYKPLSHIVTMIHHYVHVTTITHF